MQPKCIVLDEPTAMLDPRGRKEVMEILQYLNQSFNITIILITHHMNEAALADMVYVMNEGKVEMEGTPREIFSQVSKLRDLKLDVPQVTEIAYGLMQKGVLKRCNILNIKEFVDEFEKVMIEDLNEM